MSAKCNENLHGKDLSDCERVSLTCRLTGLRAIPSLLRQPYLFQRPSTVNSPDCR